MSSGPPPDRLTQGVFPPYRAVPAPGVGMDPRVPQKVTSQVTRRAGGLVVASSEGGPARPLGRGWRLRSPGERNHDRRAASMSECRSLSVMSFRVTWMMPRSTRFRIVRETVSRLDPIICAIV